MRWLPLSKFKENVWKTGSPWLVASLTVASLLAKEVVLCFVVNGLILASQRLMIRLLSRPVLKRCFEPYFAQNIRKTLKRRVFRSAVTAAIAFAYYHWNPRRSPLLGPNAVFPSWGHLFAWNETFYPSLYSVVLLRVQWLSREPAFEPPERDCAAIEALVCPIARIIRYRYCDWRSAKAFRESSEANALGEALESELGIRDKATTRRRQKNQRRSIPWYFDVLELLCYPLPSALCRLTTRTTKLKSLHSWFSHHDIMLLALIREEIAAVSLTDMLKSITGGMLKRRSGKDLQHNLDRQSAEALQLITTTGFLSVKQKEASVMMLERLRRSITVVPAHRLGAAYVEYLLLLWNAVKQLVSTRQILELSKVKLLSAELTAKKASDSPDEDCAVCLHSLWGPRSPNSQSAPELPILQAQKIEEPVGVYPCQHVFHDKCLADWIAESFTCPLCRSPLQRTDSVTPTEPSTEQQPELDPITTEQQATEQLQQRLSVRLAFASRQVQEEYPPSLFLRDTWLMEQYLEYCTYFRILPAVCVGTLERRYRQPLDSFLYPIICRVLDVEIRRM
jgi:hypothetical protein